jgi:hypothetical protein
MRPDQSGRRIGTAGPAALAMLALAGCAVGAPTPASSPSYSSTYVAPPATELAPLTGEVVPAGSLTTPSLAAKIDNDEEARPQIGLERTDLVFEELIEGGVTRYVAVWHSDVPAEIGPIRSIRPMDPDIISPLGGIVAYSGGQEKFVVLMRDTNVYNAIHGQPDTADFMYRTTAKAAPHNVVVKAPELIAMHLDLSAPPQQFSFAPDLASATAPREGGEIDIISLRFWSASTPSSWNYDPTARLWLRSQAGVADLDGAGAQLSAVNVIVLRVPVTIDQSIPKTEMIGSGEAWVSTGGHTVHATWSKATRTAPIRLVDDTGTVVRLAPGNSWIELVPLAGSAEFTPPAAP